MDDDDLPVVARMMVEIRSDGKRTIARGAIENVAEDGMSPQRTQIEARGDSPMSLALELARSMTTLPLQIARSLRTARAALPEEKKPSRLGVLRGLLRPRR